VEGRIARGQEILVMTNEAIFPVNNVTCVNQEPDERRARRKEQAGQKPRYDAPFLLIMYSRISATPRPNPSNFMDVGQLLSIPTRP
jgi:hypothetical protein